MFQPPVITSLYATDTSLILRAIVGVVHASRYTVIYANRAMTYHITPARITAVMAAAREEYGYCYGIFTTKMNARHYVIGDNRNIGDTTEYG